MSYYDHAVMMAMRLGPWGGPGMRDPRLHQPDRREHRFLEKEVIKRSPTGRFYSTR